MGIVRDVFISGIQPQRNLLRPGLSASTYMVSAALLRMRTLPYKSLPYLKY